MRLVARLLGPPARGDCGWHSHRRCLLAAWSQRLRHVAALALWGHSARQRRRGSCRKRLQGARRRRKSHRQNEVVQIVICCRSSSGSSSWSRSSQRQQRRRRRWQRCGRRQRRERQQRRWLGALQRGWRRRVGGLLEQQRRRRSSGRRWRQDERLRMGVFSQSCTVKEYHIQPAVVSSSVPFQPQDFFRCWSQQSGRCGPRAELPG